AWSCWGCRSSRSTVPSRSARPHSGRLLAVSLRRRSSPHGPLSRWRHPLVTALESKAELAVLTGDAADTADWMLRRTSGRWESRRLQLLGTVPDVVGYYSEGSAALAADFYDDSRAAVRAPGRFMASAVVLDRTVKIRRSIAWAADPLSTDDVDSAVARL